MKPYLLIGLFLVGHVVDAKADDRIAVRVGCGTAIIAKDNAEFEQFCDDGTRGGGILLLCKQVQLQRDVTSYVVTCTDAIFITAAGVEGTAPVVRCDLLANSALFIGGKEKSVRIIRDTIDEADITRMSAEKIEMQLTPIQNVESKPASNPMTKIPTEPTSP